VGAIHFQTSAKFNKGVEDMFLTLTQKMLETVEEKEAQNAPLSRQNSQRRNVVVVDDDQVPPPPTRQCCGNS
jgi:Ras-related protein Rab-21